MYVYGGGALSVVSGIYWGSWNVSPVDKEGLPYFEKRNMKDVDSYLQGISYNQEIMLEIPFHWVAKAGTNSWQNLILFLNSTPQKVEKNL